MTEAVMVCRKCAQGWTGVSPGERCPSGDGAALIHSDVHHANANDAVLGKVIAGKYPLIDKLGAGGFGAVYRGIQEPVGRAVAVKVIAPNEPHDASLRARFFREARVVARLSNPATVTLHDYGEDTDGTLFMVFELIEGDLLARLIHREGRLNQRRASDLMVQTLSALSEAHSHGLVHRDLKPENLMVISTPMGDDKIKVLDFGIAKVLGQEGADDVRTRDGIVLGTPRYMSPEQSQDGKLDGRSDLYAVGVMLYEMLSGKPPFEGVIPLDILMAHISKPVPPLPANLGIEPKLAAVVMRALEKKPDDRHESAEAMARALREAFGDGPMASSRMDVGPTEVLSQTSTIPDPFPPIKSKAASGSKLPTGPTPTPKSGRSKAPLAIVLLLLLAGGGAAAWFLSRPTPKPKPPVDAAPVTVDLNFGAPPSELASAVNAAKAGDEAAAATALATALAASSDRAALARAARALPELSKALRAPEVEKLLEE